MSLLTGKPSEDNLSRCVKFFRETGGVYRRKTTSQPLKRTAAVIETGREKMENAPHTSIRQLSQHNRLNLVTKRRRYIFPAPHLIN
jgi:hypothetical protein